ncbi:hypothetical protein CSOJ01_05296 [Colletotrichum sojae]|uniref:Uncharacterized protein n=1 Tax=Colletotrichum sojae TaxID=2175907 RepID=A0A8H6JFK0_9PEZI|nr:hypothetical protein CSOJ01_05296 [Colletotrichum sojae]
MDGTALPAILGACREKKKDMTGDFFLTDMAMDKQAGYVPATVGLKHFLREVGRNTQAQDAASQPTAARKAAFLVAGLADFQPWLCPIRFPAHSAHHAVPCQPHATPTQHGTALPFLPWCVSMSSIKPHSDGLGTSSKPGKPESLQADALTSQKLAHSSVCREFVASNMSLCQETRCSLLHFNGKMMGLVRLCPAHPRNSSKAGGLKDAILRNDTTTHRHTPIPSASRRRLCQASPSLCLPQPAGFLNDGPRASLWDMSMARHDSTEEVRTQDPPSVAPVRPRLAGWFLVPFISSVISGRAPTNGVDDSAILLTVLTLT